MARSFLSSIVAISLLLHGVSAALDPIVIKGSKFFYKTNGTQFFIKGVAYQSGIGSSGSGTVSDSSSYTDPLANATTCKRDIPYLQKLGTNTIRTYALDPTLDHDDCMQMLQDAGIYVISDLGEPDLSINRASPAWNLELYDRYTAVVDAMQGYTNVIGFFAGNEVTNNATYSPASAYVKAAVRDTKAYISSKGYRAMGVGYAADDDASVRKYVADYLNCGDSANSIDFWGYNIYEWCGDSSYVKSGYINRTAEFKDYNVPVFFAEYGCNTQGGGAAGRKFTEVAALYGDLMTPVFSGGIVYEYFQEDNDYGLVSAVDTSSVSTLADFGAYSSQIHAISPSSVVSASYTPTNTAAQSCPTVDSSWQVAATGLPPTPDAAVCNCMVSTLTCTVSDSVSSSDYDTLFSEVCGYNDGAACVEITANTTAGTFGAYSMCNATQQLSYAFNAYYVKEGTSDACDFDGSAQIVKAAGAASSCSSIIAAATSNAATANESGGSSSGAAASSSKSKGAAASVKFGASVGISKFCFVAYASTALLSALGMVLL